MALKQAPRKHNLPLGTEVSFEGDSTVYEIADYQDLIGPCPPDCPWDHECFDEPYITVRRCITRGKPLRELAWVFDNGDVGRKPTAKDKGEESK